MTNQREHVEPGKMRIRHLGPFRVFTLNGRVMEVAVGKLHWYPWTRLHWFPNPHWRRNPWTGE